MVKKEYSTTSSNRIQSPMKQMNLIQNKEIIMIDSQHTCINIDELSPMENVFIEFEE